MRSDKKVKNKKSFTLVEIVFTVSIIGILLAILLPVMSTIKLSAKKVKDVSNLKKIAEAWKECVVNRGWEIYAADPWVSESILKLAGIGRTSASDMVLNDPYVWISPGDKYASKVVKDVVCHFDPNEGKVNFGADDTDAFSFSNVDNSLFGSRSSSSFLVSYCFVTYGDGTIANIPLDTTPLAFTRGLCIDGTWDEKAGLYGSKGGYVVYCDGHVTWFDGSKPAKFLKWDQTGYTSDIQQAVPPQSGISCHCKVQYKGNNLKLIMAARDGSWQL